MGKDNNNNSQDPFKMAWRLLSESNHGILSTHSREMAGYPFGSLVPYSTDKDGWPLMLLSHLAKHSRNLQEDPHCSLIITEAVKGDIQQARRLTVIGQIEQIDAPEPTLTEHHFSRFPDSRPHYEQLNFQFLRLVPKRFYWVGGFGAARWISTDQLKTEGYSVNKEI